MTKFIIENLRRSGVIEKEISSRFLVRNWPPAFTEWSTKAVHDAFYASPQFPRLLKSETIKDTIARGVSEGHIAYAAGSAKGKLDPFIFKAALDPSDVEISEDTFILTAEEAEKHIEPPKLVRLLVSPPEVTLKLATKQTFTAEGLDQFGQEIRVKDVSWSATGGKIGSDGVFAAGKDEGNFLITAETPDISARVSVIIAKEGMPTLPTPPTPKLPRKLVWVGEVDPRKWTNFYMKVLTKLVLASDLKLNVRVEATPKEGVTDQQVEETKAALRGLGLNDDVRTE